MFLDEEIIEAVKKNAIGPTPATQAINNIYSVINERIKRDFGTPQTIASAQMKAQRIFNLIKIAHNKLLKDNTYSDFAFLIEPKRILDRIHERIPEFKELHIKL